jgi:hypothetical protein
MDARVTHRYEIVAARRLCRKTPQCLLCGAKRLRRVGRDSGREFFGALQQVPASVRISEMKPLDLASSAPIKRALKMSSLVRAGPKSALSRA